MRRRGMSPFSCSRRLKQRNRPYVTMRHCGQIHTSHISHVRKNIFYDGVRPQSFDVCNTLIISIFLFIPEVQPTL